MGDQKVLGQAPAMDRRTFGISGVHKKRIFNIFVALFVVCGILSLSWFMVFVMPVQDARRAQSMYASSLRSAQVGSVVAFGAYEQDGDAADGAEPIEWLVLSRQDDQVLLLSRYALDCMPYESVFTISDWKESTILEWLNDTFYPSAFSLPEQSMITRCSLSSGQNPMFRDNDEVRANAKVFLLSVDEAKTYFEENSDRICKCTPFVEQQGIYVTEDGNCRWWLRTAGFDVSSATHVRTDGSISPTGQFVQSMLAIRPAMWVAYDRPEKVNEVVS